MTLFGRLIRLTVGQPGTVGKTFNDFSMHFKVHKTTKRNSNKAEIKLYNVNDETLSLLREPGLVCSLRAGYADNFARIFIGDIKKVVGPEREQGRVVQIFAGEAEIAITETPCTTSVRGPISTADVLKRICDLMGIGYGNIDTLPNHYDYQVGYAYAGLCRQALDELAYDLDVQWSVTNGELVLVGEGVDAGETGILLSPQSGLIDSPKRLDKGIVECKSLLQPGFQPGKAFVLESETVNGIFVPREVTHEGGNRTTDFYTSLKSKERS